MLLVEKGSASFVDSHGDNFDSLGRAIRWGHISSISNLSLQPDEWFIG
jgi:hypothetical protein